MIIKVAGSKVEIYEGKRKVAEAIFYDLDKLKRILDIVSKFGQAFNVRVIYVE